MSFGIPELLVILTTIFWIWMLVECITKEPPGNDKIIWIVVIVFTHFIGALLYFLIRRRQGTGALRL